MCTFSCKGGICKWLAKMSLTVCKCWQGTNSFRRYMNFKYFNPKNKISKHFQFWYVILQNHTHVKDWQKTQDLCKYQCIQVLVSLFSLIAILRSVCNTRTPVLFEDFTYRLAPSAHENYSGSSHFHLMPQVYQVAYCSMFLWTVTVMM